MEQIDFRSFEQLQIPKRIELGILAKFGDDKSINTAQGGDLTIDVEHLRLEKISAKTGDYRFHLGIAAASWSTRLSG